MTKTILFKIFDHLSSRFIIWNIKADAAADNGWAVYESVCPIVLFMMHKQGGRRGGKPKKKKETSPATSPLHIALPPQLPDTYCNIH